MAVAMATLGASMKRILLLSARDWLGPNAGPVECYVREVAVRLASWGHYVAVVSHDTSALPWSRGRRPKIEVVDGVQIGRLGLRCLYRAMVRLLIGRLVASGKLANQFDVLIDCITSRPLRFAETSDVPVIPLVFALKNNAPLYRTAPGPVIATTQRARDAVKDTGLLDRYIVQAPFGVGGALFDAGDQRSATPLIATPGSARRALERALGSMQPPGRTADIAVFPDLRTAGTEAENAVAEVCGRAWVGFCGPGEEWQALTMAACGLPVVCPDSPAGREFVDEGVTGLLYREGDRASLAGALTKILTEVLRKRLSVAARARLTNCTWDRTAGLVLATIENLGQEQPSTTGSEA